MAANSPPAARKTQKGINGTKRLKTRENLRRIKMGISEDSALAEWEHKCPVCGKLFMIRYTGDWAWATSKEGRRLYVCSYTCLRKVEKEREEARKKKKEEREKKVAERAALRKQNTHCAVKTHYIGRANNVYLEYEGEKHTLAEWSDITGIKYGTIYTRYTKGWSAARILGREKQE